MAADAQVSAGAVPESAVIFLSEEARLPASGRAMQRRLPPRPSDVIRALLPTASPAPSAIIETHESLRYRRPLRHGQDHAAGATGARAFRRAACVVSLIKHSHKNIDIDRPGKDSFRLRESGCKEVLLLGNDRWALMHELRGAEEPPLDYLLDRMQHCDLVLVEGFKNGDFPKLEVWRAELGKPTLGPTGRASWRSPATRRQTGAGAAHLRNPGLRPPCTCRISLRSRPSCCRRPLIAPDRCRLFLPRAVPGGSVEQRGSPNTARGGPSAATRPSAGPARGCTRRAPVPGRGWPRCACA